TLLLLSLSICFAKNSTAQDIDTGKHIFQLGQVNILGTKDSLRADKLNVGTINLYNRTDVAQALNLIPGVSLTLVGQRNESAVNVRGFDVRQVPVYLDGVPLYVPYDGYVDLARYTTAGLSQIQVSKGYSSVLFGPNAAGGAINLISRKPVKLFEMDALAGYLNGGYRLSTNIGSKLDKFYFQVSASQLKRDYFPMSKSFDLVKNENGGHRDNSNSNDVDVSGKIGFTPSKSQEYVIGYSYHIGKKGTPVYAGNDAQNTLLAKPRYWKWPNWDTQNLYFITKNALGDNNSIKTTWYYTTFKNRLESYDDAKYNAMTKAYAFTSIYNDHTLGSSIVFENTSVVNNSFSLAAHFKQDVHKEYNIGEPERRNGDNNFTIGAEDTYQLLSGLKLNAGVSYMNRKSIATQQYNSITKVLYNLPDNNNSAWNLQGLLQYDLNKTNAISFSVARKTRFATIKDRYSFKLGTAIPNPDLKAEVAVNYDLTYRGVIAEKLTLQASGFYSKINNSIQTVNNVAVDAQTQAKLSQVQNVGKAEYYGAELAAGYAFIKELRVDASYTHIIRNNLSAPKVFFTDVPKNKVFASLQYTPCERFYFLATEEYNSKRYSSSYGTVSGEFYLTGIKTHVNIIKGFSVEAGANNLFDRNYTIAEGYPQEGRNYFANVIYRY
ncbi:MAG: TonB-dependent receptor, partial [Sphingobacteriaceae bacterium]